MLLGLTCLALMLGTLAEECGDAQPSVCPAMLQGARARSRRAKTVKKGVGLPSFEGKGATQLLALNVSWFYSWGLKPKIEVPSGVEFVPIMQKAKYLQWSPATGSKELMGFNEPDHEDQANLTVAEALSLWPQVVAKVPSGGRLGSPATAGNPVTGSWLPEFMAAAPHVDFVCVHWFKGPKAEKFKSDIQQVIDTYQKPVWVTEFAAQTISESVNFAGKYGQEEVNDFIQEVIPWMESHSMIERYAWHDSKSGSSGLYDSNLDLSETGLVYAMA